MKLAAFSGGSINTTKSHKQMKKLLLLTFGILSLSAASASEKQTGEETALYLNEAYMNTTHDCYGGPAFLCSGVTFRGGNASEYFHVWNPSPNSVVSGGVSFSYIRKDAKYERLAYGYTSGFILYPIYFSPNDKIDLHYLCIFPHDGDTNSRTDRGCGETTRAPFVSLQCDQQGIETAEQWKEQWVNQGRTYYGQCGFDISEDTGQNTTERFYQGLRGTQLIDVENTTQNEIRIETWDQDIGSILPIQAFFYLSKSKSGLKDAQFYQRDFYRTEGVWIPIIEFKLPKLLTDDASFSYYPLEQAIPEPM